jgi:signal transduction histidine kinase
MELRIENKRLVVQIRDNGAGFEPKAAVNGHGLASMRDRVQRLAGRIDFATNDRGTAITLEVPLRKRPARAEFPAESPLE